MELWEAILLGIIQGITEFLPVSSSGHLEIAHHLLGLELESNLTFTIVVHGATVLSTIVVLWRELRDLIAGALRFRMNFEMHYILKILLSMLPIALVGLFFKEQIESLFTGNLLLVGVMLLVTALLLFLASRAKPHAKRHPSYGTALLMGVGQSLAALPGLSRSGTTISLGLLAGASQRETAQFSFLMVLPPIIGMNILDIVSGGMTASAISTSALVAGFISAFVTGYLACRLMLNLVRRKGFAGFAIYCAIIGLTATIYALV